MAKMSLATKLHKVYHYHTHSSLIRTFKP